jgi:uncharacterized protein (DUF2267 family)
MTKSSPKAHAVQVFDKWLKELLEKAELADEAAAYSVLRTVLHQLRDRLTLEEAVDLGAQMPLIVRGLFFEGWQPHKVPRKIRTKEKFLGDITDEILPFTYPVEWAVKSVFALLAHHCDPGEIADVIDQLPGGLKELWPESSQSFRPHSAPDPDHAMRKQARASSASMQIPARHHTPDDDPAPGTAGTGEDVCPECHGRGKVIDKKTGKPTSALCERCDGTGRIIEGIG